jgi:hypothetical protein
MELKDSEIRNETIEEFQKSQSVRLIDVFIISPILVYAGVKYFKVMPKFLSISLITIGVATTVYNGRNFLINKNNNNKNK